MDSVATISTDDDGKTYEVPETCIGKASDARDTISTLIQAEETRSNKRARINGMLNGNPPWPALLRQKGMAERANFTGREAEGFIAAAKTPYYSCAFKAPRFIQLTMEYAQADPAMLDTWAGKIATRYQYALEDRPGLDMHMQRSQFQMIVHGSGPIVWEDEEDWYSTSRMAGQLLLPDDASADIDEWETCGCQRSYLPTDLWRKIKNESHGKAMGWNVPAVKRAIMNAAPEAARQRYGAEWEQYEADMRKGVTGWDAKSKRIFVADLFQKEFSSNRVSHFIIEQTNDGNLKETSHESEADAKDDEMKGFLFRKLDRYECFTDFIDPFLYDVGPDGQWHSVKGAGPKIFDYCSASDRLMCRTLDAAMAASGIILRARDVKALGQAAIVPITGATVVGPDYELQQQRYAPDIEAPMALRRDMRDQLSRNTGQYQAHYATDEHAPTLGQQQMTAQEQNSLAEGDASRYYKYLDRFHRNTFFRMLKMGAKLFKRKRDLAPETDEDKKKSPALTTSERLALKFFKGCIQDGVPEEMLKPEYFCRVKAMRLIGNGSQQMQIMIGKELMAMVPMANERGRNYIQRNLVSSLAGETVADATFPAYDTPAIADGHVSFATLENNFLRLPNGQVRRGPSDNDVVHFMVHINDVSQHAQAVAQGQDDPRALFVHYERAGPHIFEHLQAVANDPTRKDLVKQMQQAFQAMGKAGDQLGQQLEEAAQAQAKEQAQAPQPPDPAVIKALAEARFDYDLKREAMQNKHGLKVADSAFKMKLKDIEQAHDMKLSNATTGQELAQGRASAMQELMAAMPTEAPDEEIPAEAPEMFEAPGRNGSRELAPARY